MTLDALRTVNREGYGRITGHHPTPGASVSDSLFTSHTRSRFKLSAREMLNLIVKNQPYLPFKTMGAKGKYSAPY